MTSRAERLSGQGLAAGISTRLRDAILSGEIAFDEKLPGETELAARFGVSRPTMREALKRLTAENLIRSRRGPAGGTFVNRIAWAEARESLANLSALVTAMQRVPMGQVIEARMALMKSCLPFAAKRRTGAHLGAMRIEVAHQRDEGISDEDFAASEIRFHRELVDATGNAALAFQVSGVVEGMAHVLKTLAYPREARERIAEAHEEVVEALAARDDLVAASVLTRLAVYHRDLAAPARTGRPSGEIAAE